MLAEFQVIAALLVSVLGTVLVACIGTLRPRLAGPLAVTTAAAAFVLTLLMPEGGRFDLPWAPTWGLRLAFAADGLARLYGLLATGIGLLVLAYAGGYMPRHLAHSGHGPARGVRFYALMLLFMTAMQGLVLSQDVMLLIVFWDLTAITSYYLIGYEHERADSRRAAFTALLVTGISAILLIAAGVMLAVEYETADIGELLRLATPTPFIATCGVLIAVAALAKSAQAPLHFWLPRAMAAPTPVSAYLHSAAMVAAGVFLLGRVHPLLAQTPALLDGLVAIGFASMFTGGVLALAQNELKPLLANSTISQYGYVVVLLGLGEVTAAALYVVAHALAKSALFLTAGAVTEATGEYRLDRLGGLGRALPVLAVGSGLAAAGLAALPLTLGFFKDEVFFDGVAARGGALSILAVGGAALTFMYSWRFWGGIFIGPRRSAIDAIPWTMTTPIVVLGLLCGLGGIHPELARRLAVAAGTTMAGEATSLSLAYHLDLRAPNVMALATWGLGILGISTLHRWQAVPVAVSALGRRVGPERIAVGALNWLNQVSRFAEAFEARNLGRLLARILVAAAVLVGITIVVLPPWPTFRIGGIGVDSWPLILFLFLMVLAALVATRTMRPLTLVLALSAMGYSMAAVFMFFGAPDVALVAVLIETTMTLLLLGVISLLPGAATRFDSGRPRKHKQVVGVLAGGFAFVIAWGVLSQPNPDPIMARAEIELTPAAHAANVVTAILADFRGLDTLGEITVITVALLGVLTFFGRRRLT